MSTTSVTKTCIALFALFIAAGPCIAQISFGTPLAGAIRGVETGEVTFYGSTLDGFADFAPAFGLIEGGCGYGNIFNPATYPHGSAFAFNFGGSAAMTGLSSHACGTCWRICYGGTCVGAMVTDVCPGCNRWNNHIDLNMGAFQQLLPGQDIKKVGHVSITLQQQNCAPAGPLYFVIHELTPWFVKVHAQNTAGVGLTRMIEVECPTVSGGPTVRLLENTYGAVFESKANPPAFAPGTCCRFVATSFTGAKVASSCIDLNPYMGVHPQPYKWLAAEGNYPMEGGAVSAEPVVTAAGRKLIAATYNMTTGEVEVAAESLQAAKEAVHAAVVENAQAAKETVHAAAAPEEVTEEVVPLFAPSAAAARRFGGDEVDAASVSR